MNLSVSHYPGEGRFIAHLEGQVAGRIEYTRQGLVMAIEHTIVDPAFAGRGVGGILVCQALDTARANHWTVLPHCSFVKAFLEKNPEYLDLVADEPRA